MNSNYILQMSKSEMKIQSEYDNIGKQIIQLQLQINSLQDKQCQLIQCVRYCHNCIRFNRLTIIGTGSNCWSCREDMRDPPY